MFSQLASYLLGTSQANQEEADTVEENPRLRSTEGEDDWVLVDNIDSEGNSEVSSVDSVEDLPTVTEEEGEDENRLGLPTIITRSSSSSSFNSPMEESWYITPPPCFTSTGPINVQTSPLENLLIEHPSISVYHQHPHPHNFIVRRQNQQVATGDNGCDLEEAPLISEQRPVERAESRLQHREPQRHRVDVVREQEIEGDLRKQAQRVQVQKAAQTLKRGYMQRQNKAREVNCRNHRQRRGERSQGAKRSHANNNRKC